MKKLLTILFISIFLISLTSAMTLDNKKSIPNGRPFQVGDKTLPNNPIWEDYAPIEIKNSFGFGRTLFMGAITKHDYTCGTECNSELTIYTDGTYALIDDVTFYTILDDGSKVEQDVRSYQFFIKTENEKILREDYELQCEVTGYSENGTEMKRCSDVKIGEHYEDAPVWTPYNLGTKLPEGTYEIKLEAEKKASRTVDWVIETNGEVLNEWAVWDSVDLLTNITNYYKLDNTTGVVYDMLGNDDGTNNGATRGSIGKINNSFNFDGNNDYVGDLSIGLLENHTITAWIKGDSYSGTRTIITENGARSQYNFRVTDNQLQYFYDEAPEGVGDRRMVTSDFTLSTGVWYHVAVTRDTTNGELKLYINGAENKSYSGSCTTATSNSGVLIGGWDGGGQYFDGEIDELGVWDRVLSEAEINELYASGSGLTYPFRNGKVTLNSPSDASISDTNEVNFSATATVTGGATLVNMSHCDNSTGTWTCGYNTTILAEGSVTDAHSKVLTGGDTITNTNGIAITTKSEATRLINVTKHPDDTSTRARLSLTYNGDILDTASFVGDVATFDYLMDANTEYYIICDNSGASYNRKFLSSQSFPESGTNVDWTAGIDNGADSTHVYGTILSVNTEQEITSSTQTWNRTITDGIIWNVQACDSDGDCGFAASNYSVSVDTVAPTIDILYPSGLQNYGYVGEELQINYSASDSNLEECWYNYNGTNYSLATCQNFTISLEEDNYNITIWANDSVGNEASDTSVWSYKMFGGSETYDSSTTEGSITTFEINLTVDESYQISTANLLYDGTAYSSTFTRDGREYFISKSITAPAVTTQENKTFFWSIVLEDSTQLNTTSRNQTVSNIGIDDCSSYTNTLLNLSLFDEETQIAINETTNDPFINVDVDIYTIGGSNPIIEFSSNFTESNTAQVCIDNDLAGSAYVMDSKIQYGAIDYRTEQYNIQDYPLNSTSLTQTITLYDILIDSSESFTINIKDGSFLPLQNALVDISREYVSEGQFKSIEIPLSDSNGRAIASLSPGDTTYTITVSKNGEILGIFSNILVICQNQLTGECTLNLNLLSSVETPEDYSKLDNLRYTMTWNSDTRTIQVSFNTIDGSSAIIELEGIVFDNWMNDTACQDDLTSSSGTLTCVIPEAYSNQTVVANLYKDSILINSASFSLRPDPADYFGLDIYIFALLIIVTIPLMLITSVVGIVVGGIIGMVLVSILLFITENGAFGLGLSGIWLIVAGAIIIWKIVNGGRAS